MINRSHKILLTGSRTLCTPDLARHFHASGHTIFAADTSAWHPIGFSKTITKFIKTPSPRFEEEKFIEALLKVVQDEQIDIVIPMWEEAVYLSKYLHMFPETCKVFCTPFETLLSLHNKWLFMSKLDLLGIKTPKTRLVRSQKELDEIDFKFPYILKPCFSRSARNIYKVTPPQKVKLEIEPKKPWIAQEYITGKHHCSYSICNQGKVLAHSVYPVNYTMDGSSCLVFEAIHHQKNYEWVSRLVEALGYTGQISLDFIETEDDLYAIECNPRSTSGLHLFALEDRIDRAFLNVIEGTIFPKPGTMKQLAMGMIMYGLKQGIKEKRLWDYFKRLFKAKDVLYCSNDLKPFFSEFILFFKYLWCSKKLGLTIPLYFTGDLEWNQEFSQDHEEFLADQMLQECQ